MYEKVKQWNPPRTYRVQDAGFSKRIVRGGLTSKEAGELLRRLHTCATCGEHFDDCDCEESLYPSEAAVLDLFEREYLAETRGQNAHA